MFDQHKLKWLFSPPVFLSATSVCDFIFESQNTKRKLYKKQVGDNFYPPPDDTKIYLNLINNRNLVCEGIDK